MLYQVMIGVISGVGTWVVFILTSAIAISSDYSGRCGIVFSEPCTYWEYVWFNGEILIISTLWIGILLAVASSCAAAALRIRRKSIQWLFVAQAIGLFLAVASIL